MRPMDGIRRNVGGYVKPFYLLKNLDLLMNIVLRRHVYASVTKNWDDT